MPKKGKNLMGAWAFLIGVILAVIFAIIALIPGVVIGVWLPWTLFIIGIIIGLLNITDVEVQPFLLAGVVLVIVSAFGNAVFAALGAGTVFVTNLLNYLLMLFVPATIIVALKSLFALAKR